MSKLVFSICWTLPGLQAFFYTHFLCFVFLPRKLIYHSKDLNSSGFGFGGFLFCFVFVLIFVFGSKFPAKPSRFIT